MRRGIMLYDDAGLPASWATIQDLRRAAGQPVESLNPRDRWSLLDVAAALSSQDLLNKGPPGPRCTRQSHDQDDAQPVAP
jgi:hypothetical protein